MHIWLPERRIHNEAGLVFHAHINVVYPIERLRHGSFSGSEFASGILYLYGEQQCQYWQWHSSQWQRKELYSP